MNIIRKIRKYGLKKSIRFASIEIPAKFFKLFYGSFSQKQEDLTLEKFFNKKRTGMYVDIGAADGLKFSNTHYFYNKGWRGINIEPDPENFAVLKKNRPHDRNLPIGIAEKQTTKLLNQFSPSINSTFSKNVTEEFLKEGLTLRGIKEIKVDTLAHILEKYSNEKIIDILTLDTEGYDFLILQSNNWDKFRPRLICVENEEKHQGEGKTRKNELHEYLMDKNYSLIFDNTINRIYRLNS